MRWYLLSSSILRGGDLMVTEDGIRDTVRHVILPIWNTWYFLSLYANAADTVGTFRTDSEHVLDRYVLAKTHDLVADVTAAMDAYDLFGACAAVRSFLDALTNWYVRRSRERFWAGEQDAIDTLHTVLALLCRTLAPLLPLTTETIYRDLTGERSVHLTDWPSADDVPADTDLAGSMDLVRDVCSSVLSAAQDQRPAGAPAAGRAARRRRRLGPPAAVHRPDRRRGQRQARSTSPTTSLRSPATTCRSPRRRSAHASARTPSR